VIQSLEPILEIGVVLHYKHTAFFIYRKITQVKEG